jgi:FtsP/CotA-like multicopper oxidase with cupredoxin domain
VNLVDDVHYYEHKSCQPSDRLTDRTPGVTRYYDLTITNTTLAPDGFSMPVLAVNGQYPAPLIEANWGDWIEVKVNNQLVTEGTSMHWYGRSST